MQFDEAARLCDLRWKLRCLAAHPGGSQIRHRVYAAHCSYRLKLLAPSDLVDPAIHVGARPTCAAPASPAHGRLRDPARCSEACPGLVGPGVADDFAETPLGRLASGMAVELGARVPGQLRRKVSPYAQPVHFDPSSRHEGGSDRIANRHYTLLPSGSSRVCPACFPMFCHGSLTYAYVAAALASYGRGGSSPTKA